MKQPISNEYAVKIDMNQVEQLTVVGLSLSAVGTALSSQGSIDTAAGAGGLTRMCAAVAVLLYAVLESERDSSNGLYP